MRTPVRLTDVKCRTASTGSHCDGHGLYLLVKPAGTRSWLFRYALVGRQHWMGLGSFPVVTLKRAREKALEARRLLAEAKTRWRINALHGPPCVNSTRSNSGL
jgi:Arm DNA-binding domain